MRYHCRLKPCTSADNGHESIDALLEHIQKEHECNRPFLKAEVCAAANRTGFVLVKEYGVYTREADDERSERSPHDSN
jgi:hypothetical protein